MEIIGRRDRFTDTLFDNYICNDTSNICNELVCLFNQFSTRVGLLNIRTHEFIYLPAVTIKRFGSRFWYALGFDPVSKVYKVLSIYGGRYVCRTKAAIFTLGSKHWKPVEYKFLNCWRCNNKLCLHGVIYWVNDYQIHDANVLTVVAFDLNREVFIDNELVSIPFNKVHLVKYYLTSLKGNPTLFIWEKEGDEIQQLTLFNHKNPKAAWNTRSFIAHDFPKKFPYGCVQTCVAGDSIVLQPIKSYVESQKPYKSYSSRYRCRDLEKFAVE
ncbi:uncharacterized protein LOC141594579 [Silene latifolia]|uniref:uncharacterized protein LOC141594579 n=1 Tax=Silene latifolia TaxID=37657 RepID=UPI003D78529D